MQPSYLSQVLSSDKKDLNRDQAAELTEFLELGRIETQYFILLVEWNRCTSQANRRQLSEELKNLKVERLRLSKSLPASELTDDLTFKSEYFSSWVYPALHIALSIEHIQSERDLAKSLRLDIRAVRSKIDRLEREGIIAKKETGGWTVLKNFVHLDSNSDLHPINLSNWRNRAIHHSQSGAFNLDRDLLTSFCFALSEEDQMKLRTRLQKFLVEFYALVQPSPSERVCVLNIDFFQITT